MRFFRRSSVRARIAALLSVLVLLWAFAAWVTARESFNLLVLNYLETAGVTTEELVEAMQQERRLSAAVAAGGSDADLHDELAAVRGRTDLLVAGWRDLVDRPSQRFAASDRLAERYQRFDAHLADLPVVRGQLDAGSATPEEVRQTYTGTVTAGFAIYRAMSGLDDQEVARQSGLLVELSQARELLSQQDALLAAAYQRGQLAQPELVEFVQLVGAQRGLYERIAAELPPDVRSLYDTAVADPAVSELRRLQDRLMAEADPGAAAPVADEQWRSAVTAAMASMRQLELAGTEVVVQGAMPVVAGILVRLLLVGGLGLVAVLLSITTGRTIIRRLETLTDHASTLAGERLPAVVRRLRSGEPVDVAAEAPPLADPGGGEVGELATAFNRVQQAAVQAAVEQAELRRGVRDVFLSLARRTQGLVSRQLKVLDEAERREADPDKMAELFRIDHLATRMRRNAENLIVLSGASSGRTWRHPVSMVDLIRGAISEVEEYTRVTVLAVDEGAVPGQAAGDLIHLLAELVENAAAYSPPYAPVTVSGQRVARGFAIEIEDRGLGMSESELAAVNSRLADPPDFDLADASHLGHYVVAKLAQRHEVRVQLRSSPYGGVSAVALIPQALVLEPALASAELPRRERTSGAGQHTEEIEVGSDQRTGSAAGPTAGPTAVPPTGPQPATPQTEHAAGTSGSFAKTPDSDATTPVNGAARPAESAAGQTAAGLPWRVRQANLPRQLRSEVAGAGQAGADEPGCETGSGSPGDEPADRDPEEVRRMMSAYQHGTRLGRQEAADPPPPAIGRVRSSDVPQEKQEG
ncbi:nitrate- and nitrite sensing domain-containing protein [Natronosporangium hydrolyticum]|uniref:histidine kinase n=1 Tax=Natronosporangium hydrolyticum TaxID=2811111 RepID=A0A895YPA2_9ACTN|nr:nitrate- and nitrite sensing domain-containing protein [Natronosporangium hydrolyticum]QSB15788.1 nitrate- and nitrite sensing domain-containing protein [Natronosporangium hydrolyticum]